MTCNHKVWVYPRPYEEEFTGELVYPEPFETWTTEGPVPGDGKFNCTQCGKVMYYTGLWKDFWEKGIPCPGSEKYKNDKISETNNPE